MKIQIAVADQVSTSATVEAGGRSQKWFDGLTKREQKKYIEENPRSKFNPARKLKKAGATKKASVAKKAPAKATKKKKGPLTEKHMEKANATLKALDKRYTSLTDKLDILQRKQAATKTPERKAKIAAVKARIKVLNKKYQETAKLAHRAHADVRKARYKEDSGRAVLMDRIENAEKEASYLGRNVRGGGDRRKADFAIQRLEKLKARLKAYDERKTKSAEKKGQPKAKLDHQASAARYERMGDRARQNGNWEIADKHYAKQYEQLAKHYAKTGDKEKQAEAEKRAAQHHDPL